MADLSLLTYLGDPDTPFRLTLLNEPGGFPDENHPRFPFQTINDNAPLTRIIRACVTSDAGNTVREVSLMLSRDDYPLLEEAPVQLTNRDIDSIWQQAHQGFKEAGSLIDLNPQGAGQPCSTFRSLFFCTKTEVFFHPPCPRCGQTLELCRNDAILEASGLKPYSASLKRYLACPACLHSGEGRVFYSHTPDDADPACVKGKNELIAGLLRLEGGDLPCTRCPERPSCFREGLAHTRIVAIAFYPFYLLMVDAPSLNAEDYLALVSGAPPAELEELLAKERQYARSRSVGLFKDRAGQLSLFEGDARRFLEVLYLKLSLLGEIAQHTLSREGMSGSACIGPSLRSLWIRMPQQSSLLPALWSFRLAVMDLDADIPDMLPLQDEGYPHRVLGVLWFQALLKNRKLNTKTVHERIGRILREKALDRGDEAFTARNVYWNPSAVPERWSDFWDRTLALGRDLLTGMSSQDEFWNAFHELRDGIRKELFTGAAGASVTGDRCRQDTGDDEEIGRILRQIRSRMNQMDSGSLKGEALVPERTSSENAKVEGEATVVMTSTVQQAPQEEHEETVILTGPGDQEKTVQGPEEDFRTETIIMRHESITPPPDAAVSLLQETGAGSLQAADLDETTIIESSQAAGIDKEVVMDSKPSVDLGETVVTASRPAADIEETVIMGGGPAAEKPARKGPENEAGQDDPEATVIMGASPGKSPAPTQKPSPGDAADDLTETVIMTPKKK